MAEDVKRSVRPKWEYLIVDTQSPSFKVTSLEEKFKRLGDDGWELCPLMTIPGLGTLLVFKRLA